VVGDPTEAILVAAGRLFGELGVAGTTMSRLAEEVGLKQSSLYYYFRSREAVTAALVARANVVPLELVDRIRAEGGSAPAQLHRFIRGDVEALCLLPFDIGEIHRIAARERARFGDYWDERARLERRLATIIRRGVAEGDLRTVDAMFTALTIMSHDEGVQNWYRLGTRRKPADIGAAMADLVVGGLLSPSCPLADVVAESDELGRG
jgi:TetR/AcrR family transcriptional regulator